MDAAPNLPHTAPRDAPSPTAGTPGPEAPRQPRVLVVDDNSVNQRVAVTLLEERSCLVDAVSDGVSALARLALQRYDVVLMDAHMPGLDGYETTRELRRREGGAAHTPVVGLTADALAGSQERCLAAGMDDFLTKPIDADRLFELLSRHAGGGPVGPAVETDRLEHASDGERAFQRELVGLFESDVARQVDGLLDDAFARRADRVLQRAHSIKGAASSIGAVHLSWAACALEQAARDRGYDRLAPLARHLIDEFALAREHLTDYVR